MSSSASPLRLYVPDDLGTGVAFRLSADQARYVAQVMRRKVGDPILVFNGRDGEWLGTLEDASKKQATLAIVDQTRPQSYEPDLHLLFAPVKRTATDLIVQKATELGVSVLKPVVTEHTNSHRVNEERFISIATEAAEQSRRLTVPKVHASVPLADAIKNWPNNRPLFILDETGGGAPIAQVLGDFQANQTDEQACGAAFVMGPEGGFAESELDLLGALPFSRSVSLGPRILRAETAALAALVCWQALCGDWGSGAD